MPTIASSLATDLLGVSWALLSYQLSNIGLSIVFGRLSDLWGREKIFALGFLVFTASSLLRALPIAHSTDTVSFCAGCWRGNPAVLQPSLGGGVGT